MIKKRWLLYGANGYSGERAARAAVAEGMEPVLAGRNESAIAPLAKELNLSHRVFSLDDPATVQEQLWDIGAVVHAAGPFSKTARPMIEACLQSRVHYADITGEIAVFDLAQSYDRLARKHGVVLCPGVGFDVIPTDCLAAQLHEQMPDATSLTLGFSGNLRPSRGTARTALEGAAAGMMVRRNGALKSVPRDFEMRTINFGNGARRAAVIPWGDLSTAAWTTGIENISVYIPEKRGRFALKLFPLQQFMLKIPAIRNMLQRKIDEQVRGPDPQDPRNPSSMYVWGEIRNTAGRVIEGRLTTADGYSLTAEGMLLAARKLRDHKGKGGYFTPSQFFGNDVVSTLPGSSEPTFSELTA